MSAGEFFAGLYHFFNDFIGLVVPGLFFLLGVYLLNLWDAQEVSNPSDWGAFHWVILIVVSYVLGHLFLQVNEILLKTPILKRRRQVQKSEIDTQNPIYQLFAAELSCRVGHDFSNFDSHDLRNIAMTLSAEAGEIGRRFMFIALACFGVATALLLLSVTFAISEMPEQFRRIEAWIVLALLLVGYGFLLSRGLVFRKRAFNVTFSIAIGELSKLSGLQQKHDE